MLGECLAQSAAWSALPGVSRSREQLVVAEGAGLWRLAPAGRNLSGDNWLVHVGAIGLKSCRFEVTGGGHFSGWLRVVVAENHAGPDVGQFCRPGYMGWCLKGAHLLLLALIFSRLPSWKIPLFGVRIQ